MDPRWPFQVVFFPDRHAVVDQRAGVDIDELHPKVLEQVQGVTLVAAHHTLSKADGEPPLEFKHLVQSPDDPRVRVANAVHLPGCAAHVGACACDHGAVVWEGDPIANTSDRDAVHSSLQTALVEARRRNDELAASRPAPSGPPDEEDADGNPIPRQVILDRAVVSGAGAGGSV